MRNHQPNSTVILYMLPNIVDNWGMLWTKERIWINRDAGGKGYLLITATVKKCWIHTRTICFHDCITNWRHLWTHCCYHLQTQFIRKYIHDFSFTEKKRTTLNSDITWLALTFHKNMKYHARVCMPGQTGGKINFWSGSDGSNLNIDTGLPLSPIRNHMTSTYTGQKKRAWSTSSTARKLIDWDSELDLLASLHCNPAMLTS